MRSSLYLKTNEEIELIRESSLLVGKTLAEVARAIRPGITTGSLDDIAEDFIRSHHAVPAFKGYKGFPNALCTSVNEQVVHGIPGMYELKEGDIVSVDCGIVMNGFFGDSAYTFTVGEIKPQVQQLLKVTRESLYKGIEMASEGKRVGDISAAIQNYVEGFGYSAVRELVGHGIGKNLHEEPEVPNYGKRGSGPLLQEGMVIAIEPMINMGKKHVIHEKDGWTVAAADGLPSAHFEHTVAVRKGKADILSSFDEIEKVLEEKILKV
jgi:methionyl aminopeptidase